jgi:hypothetical protein
VKSSGCTINADAGERTAFALGRGDETARVCCCG